MSTSTVADYVPMSFKGLGPVIREVILKTSATIAGQNIQTLRVGKIPIHMGGTVSPIQELRLFPGGGGIALKDHKGVVTVIPFDEIRRYELTEEA